LLCTVQQSGGLPGPTTGDILSRFARLSSDCAKVRFVPWSSESLQTIVSVHLRDMHGTCSAEDASAIRNVAVRIHESMRAIASDYLRETGRFNYVTIVLLLDFARSFLHMFASKAEEINTTKSKLANGLTKMADTSRVVSNMQDEIDQLIPKLEKTALEMEDLMINLKEEQKMAEFAREQLQEEEKVLEKDKKEANVIKEEAMSQLNAALPELEKAVEMLNSIKKSDVSFPTLSIC
jgi:dynein heavy chain